MTTPSSNIANRFPKVDHASPIGASQIDGKILRGTFYDAVEIPRAVVWHEFGVASVKGRLVTETTINAQMLANLARRNRLRRLPVLPVPFRFAALNVGSSHKGFFHQWVDALPRAWVLGQIETSIDHVIVSQELSPEYHEILRRMAQREVRIWRVPRAVRLRTPAYVHLPVPFRQPPKGSSESSKGLPAEYITQFREHAFAVLGLEGADANPLVYVSREYASVRRFTNEATVQAELARLGFLTTHLEKLTITEQAKLFHGSDIIVAQHGAGLTNLMHCRPGTKLVEVFHGPSGGAHSLYRDLAAQFGLEYETLTLDGSGKDAEVSLPVDTLREFL